MQIRDPKVFLQYHVSVYFLRRNNLSVSNFFFSFSPYIYSISCNKCKISFI